MLREINFMVFRKLLEKSKLKAITIDIDSSVVNVGGHQEGAVICASLCGSGLEI
jgi:hypothetical protein